MTHVRIFERHSNSPSDPSWYLGAYEALLRLAPRSMFHASVYVPRKLLRR